MNLESFLGPNPQESAIGGGCLNGLEASNDKPNLVWGNGGRGGGKSNLRERLDAKEEEGNHGDEDDGYWKRIAKGV